MYVYFSPKMISETSKDAVKLDDDKLFIGSISDLLTFSEGIKNQMEGQTYNAILDKFEKSNIFWAELTTEVFIDNVFEDFHDYSAEYKLDSLIHNSQVNPTFTCNCIILRPNNFDCFWDQDVYDEMIDAHA